MTKKEILETILFCIDNEGDGGCSSLTDEEYTESRKFITELLNPIDKSSLRKLAEDYAKDHYSDEENLGYYDLVYAYEAGYTDKN